MSFELIAILVLLEIIKEYHKIERVRANWRKIIPSRLLYSWGIHISMKKSSHL